MFYKSRKNEIIDSEGKQVAVILPSNCSKKATHQMAAYAAQQMNHEERRKNLEKQREN
jgi:hypothetical protein